MMLWRRLALVAVVAAACLLGSQQPASAQCTGVFTAGQVCGAVVSGAPKATAPTSWFDAAYCSTVGYAIVRLTGAWTCSQGVPVDVTWFGVVADGSSSYSGANASANSTPLANALATGQCVFFPNNTNGYSIPSNTLTISTGRCIQNPTQVTLKAQPGAGQFVFRITAFQVIGANAYLDNFIVNTSGASSGSTVFRFGTSSGVVFGAQLSRLMCLNAYECIGDEVHATNYIGDIKMYDIRAILTLGRQIYIRRSRGFIWGDSIRIDQTQGGQTIPVTWNGAQFDDIIGIELNRFDVVGPSTAQTTTYQATSTGLVITGAGSGIASAWLNRILVDNTSGNGVTLSGFNYLNANWLETFGNLGNGINLTNIAFSELTNVFNVGGVGLPGAAAGANGFTCNPCTNVSISNLLSSNNTGQGLSIAGASAAVAITNYQATGNTGFATALSGTTNGVSISGGSWTTNGGLLSNGSTGGNIVIRWVDGYPWRTGIADANYTALPSDDSVSYTSISAARTVTLPAASLFPQGRTLTIQDVSGSASTTNTISAAPNGTDTINGSNTTQVMVRNARGSVELQSNGSNAWTWVVRGVSVGGTGLTSISAAGQVLNSTAANVLAATSTPTLGASGTLGSMTFGNATSGTVTLQPVTGALGTVTLSMPAITDTLVTLTASQTLTNKSLTSPTLTGSPVLSLGGSTTGLLGATSNYNVISLNSSVALNGSLGIFGGAGGDPNALYLSAPTSIHYYIGGVDTFSALATSIQPVTDNAIALGTASLRWSNAFLRGTANLLNNSTATSGGVATAGVTLGTSGANSVGIYFGSGAPTISAPQGSLYLRTDGSSTTTRAYINTNGSTGWTNITTGA